MTVSELLKILAAMSAEEKRSVIAEFKRRYRLIKVAT